MTSALEGIRVVDLSRVLAGPFCTMILGDLGADVVKVERPGTGDDTRAWGPPFVRGESAYFLSCNRNKRSVAVDLKSEAGLEVVRRLIAGADVLVHNFRPGVAGRLGLGLDALSRSHPRLVGCAISSFGPDGPGARRPGYDALVQAEGGLMSVTGEVDGRPLKVGVALVDVLTGLFAANGIQAALLERERSGLGQRVDLSLLGSLLSALVNQSQATLMTGTPPARMGNEHPSIVPYQTFRASDDWLFVAAGNDSLFRALASVLGRPELADDARFATNAARVEHRAELVPLLDALFAERTAAEWIGRCEAAGVPAGPIRTIDQVLADPQVAHQGLVRTIDHPALGALSQIASPLRLSRTPARMERPPPQLGEHTDEVLRELGLSGADIQTLRRSGAVA